jgi:hypothetical protein
MGPGFLAAGVDWYDRRQSSAAWFRLTTRYSDAAQSPGDVERTIAAKYRANVMRRQLKHAENTTMKTFLVAVILTGSLLALGGEISDIHRKQVRDSPIDSRKSRSHDEVNSTDHGITEVGIERTACFGTCPIYTLIIKSDGTFRYKGVEYVERKGEFTGTLPVEYFHRLAQFIRDSGYMELDDEYRLSATTRPSATTYTMVVRNGKRKTVSNYRNAGPTKLWAIESLIDDLLRNAQWRDSQKANDKKK